MSLFKKLFGGGSAPAAPAAAGTEYKGFLIRPMPYQEGGQWQLCGEIEKEIAGAAKVQKFLRADRFAGRDEAAEAAIRKAKQIIDEQGEGLFK